jgi:hypothetical protein
LRDVLTIAEQAFTFVLLAFITYRITRLAILDTIFDAPRDRIHAWLLNGFDEPGKGWRRVYKPRWFSQPTWIGAKIEEMISCPYCLSVWVGAGLQLGVWHWRSIPLPALYFLALSGAGMVIYQYIDFEPEEEEDE